MREVIIRRYDLKQDFEESILDYVLSKDRIAIIGLPGVGKSALARIIAAKYNYQSIMNGVSKNKRAILLSPGQITEKTPHGTLEVVQIGSQFILIPTISIPIVPTESWDILREIISILDSLSN